MRINTDTRVFIPVNHFVLFSCIWKWIGNWYQPQFFGPFFFHSFILRVVAVTRFWMSQIFLTVFLLLPCWAESTAAEEREKVLKDLKELSGDGNIESMLLVEKGLRELAYLKVCVVSLHPIILQTKILKRLCIKLSSLRNISGDNVSMYILLSRVLIRSNNQWLVLWFICSTCNNNS